MNFDQNTHTYIIAEIGTNHGGNLQKAKDLVVACAQTGVDAVKFQTWQADLLRNPWDFDETGNRYPCDVVNVLDKLTFKREWHDIIMTLANELGIDFISAPFDLESARFLRDLKVPVIKIASGDITFYELLKEVGGYGIPVILSTGMANEEEIEEALKWLGPAYPDNVTLLHCISEYPAAVEDANLSTIPNLANKYNVPIGLSDHFMDDDPAIAAVALGAKVIEKHVTISRNDGFPDSPFAHEMSDLSSLVSRIRNIEAALGDGKICCQPGEGEGISGGRRGIYVAVDLPSGTILEHSHLRVVRPYLGQCRPVDIDNIIGKAINKDLQDGQPLFIEDTI